MTMCNGVRDRLACALAMIVTLLVPARVVCGQTPAAPPEPPPRLEASAQFTFLDTSGNASTQSIGGGGDFIWRPTPWTYNGKLIFAQSEAEDELTARSIAGLFRAGRALNPKLAVYGQYDY